VTVAFRCCVHGVAPDRMVGVSASVNLPLHHKVQKFSSDTDSPGWSGEKGRKTVMMVVTYLRLQNDSFLCRAGLDQSLF